MADAHEEERRFRARFATQHADEAFRGPLQSLYAAWGLYNRNLFDRPMVEPHIEFGVTVRSLGRCSPNTGYGGRMEITIHQGLVTEPNPDWVRNPWPSRGVRRLVSDLLLRHTVQQNVIEIHGSREPGYRGYGPIFERESNRIGVSMGLGPVVARRRAVGDDAALCSNWPHNVRLAADPGYYGDDVTAHVLDLVAGTRNAARRDAPPPELGLMEMLLGRLNAGQVESARRMIERCVDLLQNRRLRHRPVRRKAELGLEDVDGSPLGLVAFDPGWLDRGNALVRKVAEWILEARAFGWMPILADALQDVGCGDERILRHLNVPGEHTRDCWVLKGLLAAGSPERPVSA